MNYGLLSVLAERNTTVNNSPSSVTQMIDFLLGLMGDYVKLLQSIYIFDAGALGKVSLFNFLIVVAVMAIVIAYLVNVARRPNVTSSSAEAVRERAKDKAYRERTIIEEWRMKK